MRLSYEYVFQKFKEGNCELLEKEYKNAITPMRYKCECDRESKISLSNFKKGKRCKKCASEKSSVARRHDYDYIKNFIEKENYTLLSKDYINNRKKLEIKCDKGHIITMDFEHFQRGKRCKHCFCESISGSNNYNYNPDRELLKLNEMFRRKCCHALQIVLKQINKTKNTKSSI